MPDASFFNWLDVAAIAIVVIGVIQGLIRRLSGELAHLASVVAAFVTGLTLSRPLSLWLMTHTRLEDNPDVARTVAFVSTMVAAVVVMVIVRFLLRRVMSVVIEKEVDRTAGAMAGFVRASLFVLMVFLLMNMVPHDYLNQKFGDESAVGRAVLWAMPWLREKAEPLIEKTKARMEENTGTEEREDRTSKKTSRSQRR